MFALADSAAVAVEGRVRVDGEAFCQEQLAFVKGSKRDSASRIRALVEHGLGPVSLCWKSARELASFVHAACLTCSVELLRFHQADTAS